MNRISIEPSHLIYRHIAEVLTNEPIRYMDVNNAGLGNVMVGKPVRP